MHKDHQGVEEYLECIYKIEEEGLRPKTKEIAKRLGVKQGSVTEMLVKLKDEGFVVYERYHGVVLTKRGTETGRALTRKHRILEVFLHDTLWVEKQMVHPEACRLEHALSDEVETKMIKFLKKPALCPDDGKPIPYADQRPIGSA